MIHIRRIWFSAGSLGLTLPLKLAKQIGLQGGDYIEVMLADDQTIQIRKHVVEHERGLRYEPQKPAASAKR